MDYLTDCASIIKELSADRQPRAEEISTDKKTEIINRIERLTEDQFNLLLTLLYRTGEFNQLLERKN